MSNELDKLRTALNGFLGSCGRDYAFPAGGKTEMLTSPETALKEVLSSGSISDAGKVRALSAGLDWDACYSVVIFGVRLAVLAVRSGEPELYRLGVLALAAGSPKVDWRDVLGAFAIFENCGARLGVHFQAELESVVLFSEEAKLRPTIEGYFSRADELRTVEVMGLVQSGSDRDLSFTSPDYSNFGE